MKREALLASLRKVRDGLNEIIADLAEEREPSDRDAANKAALMLGIARYLEDGPKSEPAIIAVMECGATITIGILKISPHFERAGNSRFAPWQLSQKGRLWLAQQNGKPEAGHVADSTH